MFSMEYRTVALVCDDNTNVQFAREDSGKILLCKYDNVYSDALAYNTDTDIQVPDPSKYCYNEFIV